MADITRSRPPLCAWVAHRGVLRWESLRRGVRGNGPPVSPRSGLPSEFRRGRYLKKSPGFFDSHIPAILNVSPWSLRKAGYRGLMATIRLCCQALRHQYRAVFSASALFPPRGFYPVGGVGYFQLEAPIIGRAAFGPRFCLVN